MLNTLALEQALGSEVLILGTIQVVPVQVLILLLLVNVELVPLERLPQPPPKLLLVRDLGHTMQLPSVEDAQAPHPVGVPGLGELLLKVPAPAV